jgi:Golgi phosphoprotein 3
MKTPTDLSITEELLLLSLDDEKGKLVSFDSTVLSFTLAGAVLFELMLLGKIEIKEENIVAWPTEPMEDHVLDLAIVRFAKSNKVKKLSYWVGQLAKDYNKIKNILLEKLVTMGALKKEEHTFLWAFNYNRYPTDNARIEDLVRIRVRESLFSDEEIDTRDFVLLCLIGASKLEAEVFGKDDAKEARRLINYLKGNDAIGTAITKAIIDFEAALTVAIFAAVIIPTVTS